MKAKILTIFIFLFVQVFGLAVLASGSDDKFSFDEKINYINYPFFEKFGDQHLLYYIKQAVLHNHKAKSAFYKSQEFRYEIGESFSKQLPNLNVASNYLGLNVPNLDNFQLDKNAFILPFQLNWEFDLLGKNSNKTKSVKKLFLSQKFDEQNSYIMLVSDVFTTYVNILKFDKTIGVEKEILDNQKEIYEKNEKRFKNGVISKIDLNNSKLNLQTRRQEILELEKKRKFLLDELAYFISDSAYNSSELKRGQFDNFGQNVEIPCEISSDLILERPDLNAKFEKIKSARYDLLVAKKDFFPTFKITGLYALSTLSGGNFFSWNSTFAALIAGATQDIFSGGRKKSFLKKQNAKYNRVLEEFLDTNYNAIKEVNDALYSAKFNLKILGAMGDKLNKRAQNLSMDKKRYFCGVLSRLDYLESENKFLEEEQYYVEQKSTKFIDLISLYKAVGGRL